MPHKTGSERMREQFDDAADWRGDAWEEERPGETVNGKSNEEPLTIDEHDAGDDVGPIAPRQWLLGNQFCRKFLSGLIAAGSTGKSALRLVQYISLATNRPL